MLTSALIVKKRNGGELEDAEIDFLINGFCSGEVADYQMSAFAMAVCLQGMTSRETVRLTQAMLDSGERLPRAAPKNPLARPENACPQDTRSQEGRPRVDKHSTGGLGDKVSLILAPLLACCDVDVPMVSGRGLGLTGGTLDKLESIEGFRVDYSLDETTQLLDQTGAFIISANESIAPADRRLYALRDVTGTVESIPLITASILSKKLSASLDALVMDVKVGSGAFMKTYEEALALATSLKKVGQEAGLPTTALITDMDQPLGEAIGNAVEVNEAVQVLQGKPGVVRDLTIELCTVLLSQVKAGAPTPSIKMQLEDAIDSGQAMERFERMIHAQSGHWRGPLPLEKEHVITATQAGTIAGFDCRALGQTIVSLGGGRHRQGDPINHRVGLRIHHRVGEPVSQGDPILTLHCDTSEYPEYANLIRDAVLVSKQRVLPHNLILQSDSAAT